LEDGRRKREAETEIVFVKLERCKRRNRLIGEEEPGPSGKDSSYEEGEKKKKYLKTRTHRKEEPLTST